MSGICGAWRKDNPARIGTTVDAMTSGLILDASERSAQETELGAGVGVAARFSTQQICRTLRVVIACDADLYNEDELAEGVPGLVHCPKELKTAALLAGLYERFGCDFFEKLQGAFSVVLWDRVEKRLVAAIDGFGIKRLAYYQDQHVVLIASRIDALLRSGDINDPEVNPRAIANVLNFTANLAPETIFSRIQRLTPGTVLSASNGGARFTSYWDLRYKLDDSPVNETDLSRQLEATVERSVAAHCKAESFADLGAFLSGGTDSSTVLGMMTRAAQAPVKAFSIGFQEHAFNELGYAEIAAAHFHSNHYTYAVTPQDCMDALPGILRSFDEPFGNSSAIPTYFCARLASQQGVATLLAGDGGDELFGGNERYAMDKTLASYFLVPRFLRKGVIEPLVGAVPIEVGLVRKARGYIRRANLPGIERMLSFQFLRTHLPGEVFTGDFVQSLTTSSVLDIPNRHYATAPARDHLDRLLYADMKITLADNDLPKVTCTSELAGVQSRFPFLDRSVADLAGRIPAHLKVKGFQKRYLFKKAFRNLLPAEILAKKKHGFGIPVAAWLNSDKHMRELSRDTLLSARAFERGYFQRQFIEHLFHKHEMQPATYYGDTLWTLLTLELWHRQVVDQPVKVTA